MRIGIREQLAGIVLLVSLVSLAVVSIASWITNYDRVTSLRAQHLALTSSLKAAQLSSNLDLMERSVRSLATRVRLQAALKQFNQGANSTAAFASLSSDLQSALAVGQQEVLTLQAMILPNMGTGTINRGDSLINITGIGVNVELTFMENGGGPVFLGDDDLGYPAGLYPNLTFDNSFGMGVPTYLGEPIQADSSILLGPVFVNETFSLTSISVPVINNTSATDVLGYVTVVCDARLISSVLQSPLGLANTGTMLLVAPNTLNNRFPSPFTNDTLPILTDVNQLEQNLVRFVYPPYEPYTAKRHSQRAYGTSMPPLNITSYPLLVDVMTRNQHATNNAGGSMNARNEQGLSVAAGYAVVSSTLCTWALVLEQAESEAFQAIVSLRNVLLACIFATVGAIFLCVIPLAHFSSRPIRRLRDAVAKTLHQPPTSPPMNEKDADAEEALLPQANTSGTDVGSQSQSKLGAVVTRALGRKPRDAKVDGTSDPEAIKSTYPIPQTVVSKRNIVQDELSDLTRYFNEMSDELVLHYSRLEERVRQRTAELEASKIAAEAANESKTLFIANISHELKTPLNGILGMTAVCMQEDDPIRIKRSLEIIYKSGDLLHNLLTDLLTFSKNQAGQALTLDEKEFHVRDIGSQVHAIFEKKSNEGKVQLDIVYQGPRDGLDSNGEMEKESYGPLGTGRVKDMYLWGDYHRILQVVINLVSNSLKFTPEGGSVRLTIRCLEEVSEETPQSRRSSDNSTTSSSKKRPRIRIFSKQNSESDNSQSDGSKAVNLGSSVKRHASQTSGISDAVERPLAVNGRTLLFEFEVQDTGPGIAENLQQKIFEPFVQGDLRLTKKFGGTGLGLSICEQLSKLMHGSISLESELGKGSTFTLQIPLRHLRNRADSTATSHIGTERSASRASSRHSLSALQATPTRTQSPATIQSPVKGPAYEKDANPRLVGLSQPYFSSSTAPMASPDSEKGNSRLRILVAEDNKVNQEVVLRMLRLEAILDVTVAQDGQEALELVQKSVESGEPYDLILMDVMMPRLGGHDSTRMIRDLGFSAPIVALTAFTDEVNEKECKDSGMDYFLAKPLRRPALKHVLNTFCPTIREVDESELRSGEVSPMNQSDMKKPSTVMGAADLKSLAAASGDAAAEGRVQKDSFFTPQ